MGERGLGGERLATALSADVSGFTALADRVDVDELHEIVHPLVTRLTTIAERHGGLLVKYGGDAVLVLFTADGRSDGHADRALRAAAEMHAELGRVRSTLPPTARDLRLHVGVATGAPPTGIADDGWELPATVLGEALDLARRVESRTPPGETYVATTTAALTERGFEPVDGIAVDGPDGPVAVLRLPPGGAAEGAAPAPSSALDELRELIAGGADAPADGSGEQRRLITALFADIAVGSGDPETRREATADAVSRLAAVAERYGGHVARYAGDALLVFFGAPVAHDDDPVRAVLTAVEMHRAAGRGDGPGVAIRVGINSGHVVSDRFGGEVRADFSVVGDAVNVAQRLEAAAPLGATYVGELTHRLTEDRFAFEAIARLRLKGKPEPVAAWRVTGARTPAHAVRGGIVRLVGRGAELAALTARLDDAARGRGGVVAVVGEPGVGKSRLLHEAERVATGRGARWLGGRCLSYGVAIPYWPYSDLLRRAFGLELAADQADAGRRLATALADTGVPEAAPYFARLLGVDPHGVDDVGTLGAEAFRRGLHRAFSAWLRALASTAPTVVAIEDAHWVDASSAALTGELARTLGDAPVLLCLTARPEGRDVLDGVAGDDVASARLDLVPFDGEGVAALVGTLLDAPPPARLVDAVRARTSGNPFFVIEVVRGLVDGGALVRSDAGWRLRAGWDARAVPTTVEGVLSARIDTLPPAASRVLTTASVVGRQVRLPLLRGVASDVDDLDVPLAELVARGFLDVVPEDDGVLVFPHALVQDVAYSRLVRRRRRTLHRRVAGVAEAMYGSGDDVIDLLARHRYLGGGGPRAVETLLRAGERARSLYALDQAALHLSRAVELLREEDGASDRLLDVLLDLAAVREQNGEYDDAAACYEEVRDRRGDAAAWRGLASTARRKGHYTRALDAVEEAIAATGASGLDAAGLLLERGWTLSVSGDVDGAREALTAGLRAARGLDDPVTGHLLVQLARVEVLAGDSEAAVFYGERAHRSFTARDDLGGAAAAARVIGSAHVHRGDPESASAVLRAALDLANRSGTAEEIAGGMLNLAMAEFMRGAVAEAILLDRQADEEFDRIGHGSGRAVGYGNLAEKLLAAGDVEEALLWCDRALAVASAIGHRGTLADGGRTRALALLELGRRAEAAAAAERAAAEFEVIGDRDGVASCLELAARATADRAQFQV